MFYYRRMFQTLTLSVIFLSSALGQIPSLSVSEGTVEINTNFTVVCEIATNANIRFLLNNNPVGSCPPDFLNQDCSPKEIKQNRTSGLTSWTLSAAVAYEGNWSCDQSFTASNTEIVRMYKCPETIFSESGIDTDLYLNETARVNITIKIGCIYPLNNPDIWLRFLHSEPSLPVPNTVLNCLAKTSSCTTGSAYECTQEISFDMSINNGPFTGELNYTLHIDSVVFPLASTCGRLALFEPYSLRFITEGELISRDTTCDAKLIYAVHFIWTLSVAVLTFFAVIFIKMKRQKIGSKYILILAAILIDVVFECIMLWGIEYRSDFETFRTNDACNVVIIGVVCHVVIIVILVIKVVVLICFTERIQECMVSCCVSRKTTETTVESGPSANRSNDHSSTNGVEKVVPPHTHKTTQPVTTPEDITLLMHFPMPTGYQVHQWVKEDSTSLQDSSRHVTSDRGTLHIKSATAEDNGIYQSLLVSGNSELRVNVILHVTGLKSVCLMVDPLVWRLIKTKKLKQIHDLKKISKHLSINNVEGIPSNLKRSEETDITVISIRWTHNGKEITGPSPWKGGNNHLQCFTVQKETPIDEYHCKIEFSDRKSYIFIFIVTFTGSAKAKPNLYPSDSLPNDKVYPIEEVVGVPTIINTKREGTDSKLKPLRRFDQRNSDDDDY